jgi:adenylate cyclase
MGERGHMAGRRTVTVIFTDLAGSTALSQRLDVASAEELREAHFGLLGAEVAAVGGVVVKNLGDGLMVICETPTAALACAVGMQQAVERANRVAAERLTMRVGISLGEATESDGDFFGDPVVEAARLCSMADGGQILATDVVRVVAGRHAVHELVPAGVLQLKGLPIPVACVEVRWEPLALADEVGVPLPARLTAGSRGAFVGRPGSAAGRWPTSSSPRLQPAMSD